jgi:hypothetical protein
MLKLKLTLLSLLLFSTALNADVAVVYSIQDKPYFSMDIPDSWRVNVGAEEDSAQLAEDEQPAPRVITVMPEEDSILWFGTWVPYYLRNLDEAQEYLSSLDDFLVDEPVLVKTDDVNLNAMEARYFMGKGKREGKPADFFVMLFQVSDENIGVAIYIGPPATTSAHKDALLGMMKSISPIGE